MQDFSIEVIPCKTKDTIVLKIKGSVDSDAALVLEIRFSEALENGQNRIVIDLSKTDFINSSGIGLFLGTAATLRKNGGDLILAKVPKQLTDVFELMGVEEHFQMVDSLEELTSPQA